jgi:hypothetical protein
MMIEMDEERESNCSWANSFLILSLGILNQIDNQETPVFTGLLKMYDTCS